MSVHLVGAGPGDPGLITARGLELVRRCDALVYDRLVSAELVAEAPADALRVPRERFEQPELSALLVSLGKRGLEVVRLKGGDPYIFGRGGEEALALARAGIPFSVVPGVSSLAAVPASAGIPITHRGVSSQVTLVSGHDPAALDFDWLARARGTLVFLMGLAGLPAIASGLIGAGMEADTPAAVVSQGTTAEEARATAPLSQIAEQASALLPPALVVVGDVVSLAEILGRADVHAGCEALAR